MSNIGFDMVRVKADSRALPVLPKAAPPVATVMAAANSMTVNAVPSAVMLRIAPSAATGTMPHAASPGMETGRMNAANAALGRTAAPPAIAVRMVNAARLHLAAAENPDATTVCGRGALPQACL